ATESQAYNILHILHSYHCFTGLQVNMAKSTIFFRKNTSQEMQNKCCSILAGIQVHNSARYLGLPLGIGKSKRESFEYILSVVRKRILSWKNKWLSSAGKEVLIKAVLNALPVFAMS
ncbi:RNA-directed DNA polymerase (reverse transcriptase)-related family protein, partial [Striga hermonthica]